MLLPDDILFRALGCGEWKHYTLSTTTADFSLIEVVDEVSDRKVGRRMDKYLSQPKETSGFCQLQVGLSGVRQNGVVVFPRRLLLLSMYLPTLAL